MRSLQNKEPVKVTPKSMTRVMTGGARSFSYSEGCLTWSEDELLRRLELNDFQRSILFSHFCDDFLDPNSMGSKLRRLKQRSVSRLPEDFASSYQFMQAQQQCTSLIVTTYLTVNRGVKAPLSHSTFT